MRSFGQGIKNHQGKVVQVFGINKDITQEKQQEAQQQEILQALRSSQVRLKALVDNLPFRVWARDPEGKLILQNPVDIAAFGNRLGTTIEDLGLDPDTYQEWKQFMGRLQTGETVYRRYSESVQGQTRHFFSIADPLEESEAGVGIIGISIDVTEQVQAEEALRASDAKFRALVENLPFCVWARDPEGRITYQNSVDIEEFGECNGCSIEDLPVSPEQMAVARQNFDKIMSGQVVQSEKILFKSGREQYFLTIGAPILENGKPTGAIGIGINITERKRTEEALKASEAKFRALVENLPFRIWARDSEGILIYQSKSDQEQYGNYIGKRLEDMNLPEKEFSEWKDTIARIQAGEVIRSEKKENSCGEDKYLLFVGAPICQENRIIGSLGVQIDITELRQTEAKLAQARSQLEMALKGGNMGVWEADLITNNMWWSPEQYHILGFTSDEHGHVLDSQGQVVAHHPARELIFDRILPSAQKEYQDNLEKALATGHYPESEYPYIRPDGELRWLLFRAELHSDDSGQVKRLLGICIDITDRKRVELELGRLASIVRSSIDAIISTDLKGVILTWNEGAERTYGYLADEVIGSNIRDILPGTLEYYPYSEDLYITQHPCKEGRLIDVFVTISILKDTKGDPCGTSWIVRDISYQKEVERLKDQFISIVSHELRTPLTSIHGSLTTINTGIFGALHPMGQELLQIAEQNTTRLIRLINDILDLERLENSDVPLLQQPCQCSDLIRQAGDAVRPLAESAQLQLHYTLTDCTFWADPDLIVQVLTNLLSNAIKFSPPHSSIHLSTQVNETELLIAIQDQGTGIPADKLELIFGRFQQVDASDSRKKGGTGLGLAICRQIIQQHQGRIWAESRLGEGSTFYVALPLREPR
ncbi:MAG: PAS domain S-box protein [Cyanobacteriota bacterium]